MSFIPPSENVCLPFDLNHTLLPCCPPVLFTKHFPNMKHPCQLPSPQRPCSKRLFVELCFPFDLTNHTLLYVVLIALATLPRFDEETNPRKSNCARLWVCVCGVLRLAFHLSIERPLLRRSISVLCDARRCASCGSGEDRLCWARGDSEHHVRDGPGQVRRRVSPGVPVRRIPPQTRPT